MDIIEAFEKAKEGKLITRPGWVCPKAIRLDDHGDLIDIYGEYDAAYLDCEDVLATDWEVYKEEVI